MSRLSTQTHKMFRQSFILTQSKLIRIEEIITSRMANLKGEDSEVHVNTESRDGRTTDLKKISDLFGAENPIHNPIESLSITAFKQPSDEDDDIYRHEVGRINLMFSAGQAAINIYVKGPTVQWCSETYAEIEEQVERTQPHDPLFRFVHQGASELLSALMLFVVLAGFVVIVMTTLRPSLDVKIPASELKSLQEVANNAQNEGEKIDFIFQYLWATVKARQETSFASRVGALLVNPHLYFIGLPLVIIMVTFFYIKNVCYPQYVFEWGDYGEYYQTLVKRRNFLWTGIIWSLMIGIIGNLFVYSITTFQK